MEQQKREPSAIKTHEEIMALFKALESMETRVKNPDMFIEELFEPEASLQEVEHPPQPSTIPAPEPQVQETRGELRRKQREKRNKQLIFAQKPTGPLEAQIEKRFSLWKKVKTGEVDADSTLVDNEPPQQMTHVRSTFTLTLDNEGNLVGFPLKKPIPPKEKRGFLFFRKKSGSEHTEETPAKGIKGTLLRVASRFKRKKSAEGESSGGIGGKIKGIMKRKPKE